MLRHVNTSSNIWFQHVVRHQFEFIIVIYVEQISKMRSKCTFISSNINIRIEIFNVKFVKTKRSMTPINCINTWFNTVRKLDFILVENVTSFLCFQCIWSIISTVTKTNRHFDRHFYKKQTKIRSHERPTMTNWIVKRSSHVRRVKRRIVRSPSIKIRTRLFVFVRYVVFLFVFLFRRISPPLSIFTSFIFHH